LIRIRDFHIENDSHAHPGSHCRALGSLVAYLTLGGGTR
jgi:hypothetical protein